MTIALEDRVAISDLISRYTRACDFGASLDDFMQLFTPDIVLDGSLMGVFEGVEGVRRWVAECDETRSRLTMFHVVSNTIMEPIDGGVSVSTYLTEIMIFPPPIVGRTDHVTELAFTGLYTFEVRRHDGLWRIARRVVQVLRHDPRRGMRPA
jgi:hypothetical protein